MEITQSQALSRARVIVAHPALAMVGLMIGSFVGMFSETSLNIALATITSALGVTAGAAQWLITGYMLVIGIFMPLSSLLTKWATTKKIVLVALGAFIVGAVIAATSTSFPVLLVGRMIQGIGTGLVLPLMFSVAMQIVAPHQLGTVMGLAALVIMFAPAIAPTLTGLLLAKASWHAIFWVLVPFLLIAFGFVALYLDNVYQQTKTPIDWLSIGESTVGFAAIVLGASMASDSGWLSGKVLGTLAIGLIVLAAYAHRQLQLEMPILNLHVFSSARFTTGTVLVMLDFGLILSAMYLFPMYLQRVVGLPIAMTGLAMLPGGIVNAVVSGVAGRLYDNYGAKWPARIGFFIAALGVLVLLSSTGSSPLWVLILGHVVLMIGAPLAMSPAQTYGLNSLPGRLSADGSAILNTLQQIIGALATAIATSLLASGMAAQTGAAGVNAGIHAGFVFVLIIAAAGFLMAFRVQAAPAGQRE
ncbi:DHA2 family efflux MFS transporter permease subunit [Lacticaseibacillus yichunensis]|uniref:DHA2 family efflux MFS transporter permease subunit n=1 Tax=Lacticaseibacillus yichunensis TaxID=2486015 RepID=A0ABW4CU53_9LACO|nr:DHA2 family efflux MFS transporter permease subunit [Lacticaseibacillus yichunensis]